MLRSFWPNCRLDIGPSNAAMAGCSGQQVAKEPANLPPTAGRRDLMESAMAVDASRIHSGRRSATMARPMSSTTSSLAATKGKST